MKFTKKIGFTVITILLVAVCSGFADAKINKKFFDALNKGDGKTVETMLKKSKGLANEKNNNGKTALMITARENYRKIAEILIANGANVNTKDNQGWTSLMYACYWENKEIVNLLLEKGADVTIKNNDGKTAIMIASASGYKDIEELLIFSLTPEQQTAIEKERQEELARKEAEEKARQEAEELAKKEAEERERQEREAKMRYRAEDFEYGITDDGKGIRITGLKKYDEDVMVKIPATIEGFPVTEVKLWGNLTRSTVTLIGFERPSNIKEIQFYDGIVDCDLNLPNCKSFDFYSCTFKNTILVLIKEWSGVELSFQNTNIEKLIIQKGFSKLRGSFAFSKCEKLTEIIIPETIASIEFGERGRNWLGEWTYDKGYQFEGCKNLSIKTQARLRQLGYEGEF